MRYREFSELVDEVFGAALGRAYVREQVLSALDDRTAAQALEDGVEPRVTSGMGFFGLFNKRDLIFFS